MLKLDRSWRPGPETTSEEPHASPEMVEQENPHGSPEVVEPESLTSEEMHGGNEASRSVPDSPNPSQNGEQQNPSQDGEQKNNPEPSCDTPCEIIDSEIDDEGVFSKQTGGDWREPETDERNRDQAFAIALQELRERRLQRAFATIVAKTAEDAASLPVEGDDEWDIESIMRRRLDHRPLWQCRQSRERERVVIVLDTSGSCYEQAEFFQRIANLAARLGDAEIYSAPNAVINNQLIAGEDRWVHAPYGAQWPFRRRVVLFFGDFDGGDSVVEAARENRVYWFSCEGNRYQDMTEHDWCHYSLAEFRGTYYDCQTDVDVIRLARKIRT